MLYMLWATRNFLSVHLPGSFSIIALTSGASRFNAIIRVTLARVTPSRRAILAASSLHLSVSCRIRKFP